jgi:hypothetical protein
MIIYSINNHAEGEAGVTYVHTRAGLLWSPQLNLTYRVVFYTAMISTARLWHLLLVYASFLTTHFIVELSSRLAGYM